METNRNTHIIDFKPSIRAASEGSTGRIIEGYASVFNQRSKLIFEWGEVFYEVIEPGFFDDILRSESLNCIATVNHRRDLMLGRTKSGSLRLTADDKGLKYEIDVPETQLGKDTLYQVERGDFFESSFIFTVQAANVRWDKTPEGIPIRYLSKADDLFDISIVTDGAYANTNIAAREWKAYKETIERNKYNQLAAAKRRLKIITLKK